MLKKQKNLCVESCSLSLRNQEFSSASVAFLSQVLQYDMLLGLTVENWEKKNDVLVASGGTMFIAGFVEISLLVVQLKGS